MSDAYLNIKNISSLGQVLTYLKTIKNPEDVIVFFDWDDTLVNPDYDNIIEPEVTRELFDYIQANKIFYSIITARFYDTVCDENLRNIYDMKQNIVSTMHPSLIKLGVDISRCITPQFCDTFNRIVNEQGVCVGIIYMGIFFSENKGETIKNYLRMVNMKKKIIIFVDDYEPYLTEVTSIIPNIKAFRRHNTYTTNL